MLEGKTIIELTDIHTGEKEVHEDKNMITNAMNEIFGTLPLYINYGGSYSYLTQGNNWVTELFGGILLFDKALPEDANQLIAPAGTQLVGCGAYNTQNNTKGKCRGNYNQTESELNQSQKYMKFVYDFATSQANGTIASLALTSKKGGFVSYGGENDTIFVNTKTDYADATMDYTNSSDKRFYLENYTQFVAYAGSSDYVGVPTNDSSYIPSVPYVAETEFLFALDIDNEIAYYFKPILNASKELTGFKIVKRAIPIKSISLFNNMINTKPLLEEKEVSLPTPVKYNEGSVGYNFDTTTNCLFFHVTASSKPNGVTTVIKVSLNGDTVNTYRVVNNTGHKIASGTLSIFCLGEYMYARSDEDNVYQTYKIKLDNSADVLVIPSADGSNNRVAFKYQIGKRLYSSNGRYVLDTELNKIFFCELIGGNYNTWSRTMYSHAITPVINHDLIKYVSYASNEPRRGMGFLLHGCYLATINNLSQPVTKTADKTMKITYIIQEK